MNWLVSEINHTFDLEDKTLAASWGSMLLGCHSSKGTLIHYHLSSIKT